MTVQPTLTTDRLILRPLVPDDAADVQRLAGDRDIAANTAAIPHPYGGGVAEAWIGGLADRFAAGESAVFAVTRKSDGILIGAIGLELNGEHRRAELGYWIGKPYWNQGYCTEAARAVVRYGFETLGLRRIFAHHFGRNPASGKVMQKIGMQREGLLRQHTVKWGEVQDLLVYAILRDEVAER